MFTGAVSTVRPLCHRSSDCNPSSTDTKLSPNVERLPAITAAIGALRTSGPATPSGVMLCSFSNAITAPRVATPDAPGCQNDRIASGVSGSAM